MVTARQPSRLAYLVSQYPAVTHTFVLREILALRAQGWDIQTISIRSCDRPDEKLSPEELEERKRTLYVKSAGLAGAAPAHLRALLRNPLAYVSTFLFALRLGHPTAVGFLRNAVYFAQAVLIGDWLRRERIPHLHVHFSSTVALIVSRLTGIPYSATIHGSDEFIDPVGFSMEEKVRDAAFIVTVSHYARSQVMRFSNYRHWHKLELCRLGIAPEVFTPIQHNRNRSKVRLICVARLAAVKGLHLLISAVERAVRNGTPVELHLVGDGPERASLEAEVVQRRLQDSIHFVGWKNQDGVLAVYRESDIFVLTSFAEGIPVVLMEAMAMEIPCIATRVNGIPELIQDGKEGLLFTLSDEDDLAAAILRLANDAELRTQLGQAGRRKVMEEYHLARNTQRLSQIFADRLQGSSTNVKKAVNAQ